MLIGSLCDSGSTHSVGFQEYNSGMRLGFGQNSGKYYDAINSNPIQHNGPYLLFSENSHGHIVTVIAYTQTHEPKIGII